jgi:hypothetical protein
MDSWQMKGWTIKLGLEQVQAGGMEVGVEG